MARGLRPPCSSRGSSTSASTPPGAPWPARAPTCPACRAPPYPTLPPRASATKPVPITAPSWLVADSSGKIIQGENTKDVRSIASITKLMTAMIVLDAKQDLDEYIKPYTRRELIQLTLVHSDNKAAEILCNNYPGGKSSCVRALNTKANLLSLPNTRFIEPTGLSVFNVSTAEELIKIIITL